MRQTAEDTLDAALGQPVRIERLHAEVDAPRETRVRFRDGEIPLLPRGDRDDLGCGVAQQDLEKFEGGVAGAAEDGDFGHESVVRGQKRLIPFFLPHSLYTDVHYLTTDHGPRTTDH